jgi:NhaP-type Na+/H+ or K+/H+ antiporter
VCGDRGLYIGILHCGADIRADLPPHRTDGNYRTHKVFVLTGLLTGSAGYIAPEYGLGQDLILILVEFTLVLTLFTDAARINLPRHWGSVSVPVRLLAICLPLTILAGIAGASVLFPGLTLLEAALLAIILAATDAGLALPIVNNKRVPLRIRNAINIESGLNDGIVFPLFIVALTVLESELLFVLTGSALTFILEQVGFGVLFGCFHRTLRGMAHKQGD